MAQATSRTSRLGADDAPEPTGFAFDAPVTSTLAILDLFFPGFSVFSGAVQKYLHVDLNLYIPMVLLCGGLLAAWRYFSEYLWGLVEGYLMSSVDIRTDDELYNYIMAWVATQRFSQKARRFIANTDLHSRSWFLFYRDRDDDDDDDGAGAGAGGRNKKPLAYTPTFGTHYFWYRGRILVFRRNQNRDQAAFMTVSEREEISVSSFGRDPQVLKELLHEARETYMKRDECKTLIYRGTTKGGSTEPTWQRCMARTSRPFSTVILNEKVKKELIDDVEDYLNPATRRWYSNRGIPYRRGYLLYGPPGTGKSSLSLALAGFFKMRIYIVSLNSISSNEENLGSLFAELPRRCVVLLEDIDTAGLTHTRDDGQEDGQEDGPGSTDDAIPGQKSSGRRRKNSSSNNSNNAVNARLSLSGLLNILDGVASQEGRVLIMTTNHLEKLDKALIRPGRVDMIVKFDRADKEMTVAIFRAIFAPIDGDNGPPSTAATADATEKLGLLATAAMGAAAADTAKEKKAEEEEARKREEIIARIDKLAEDFAEKIPAHEFSPAEIQGFLLKNKRNPEAAVSGAEQWVITARKEKKEKELKAAEEKRKADEEKKNEKGEKEKQERARTKKEKGKKKNRRSKKDGDDSDESSSSSPSSSSEEEESEARDQKETGKKSPKSSTDANKKKGEAASASTSASGTKRVATAGDEQVEVVDASEPVNKGSPPAEEKLLAEEGKHGGDSGYGTP